MFFLPSLINKGTFLYMNLTATEKNLIKAFDRPSIRIRIPRLAINQSKHPLLPNWPNFYEPLTIEQILAKGYNYGIRTGKKIGSYYLIVLDLDDAWAKTRLAVKRYVQTSKGIHLYCLIKELPPYLILKNQAGKRIGELHGLGRQVVGIGSLHQSGVRYTLKGQNNQPWFWKLANLKELEEFCQERGIFWS